jgi:hypothetical protein
VKRNSYSVCVIIAFVISNIVTSLAQPSQLAKAVNFRNNYIPIEIQNGFVLDSVFCTYSPGFSRFNTFHFKYNSSRQLIWEDDLGAVVKTYTDYTFGRPRQVTVYYQLFSDNSYNEKGLLSLQCLHYVDSVLMDGGQYLYSYDKNDRIISVNSVTMGGDTNNSQTYQYNSSGNLTSYYAYNHYYSPPYLYDSSSIKYDSFNRLKSRLDMVGHGYFYEYNSIGNATCTIGDVINQSIIDTLQVHRFEYDGSGRELIDIWNSGTVDSLFYEKVVFTYDGSGKIFSIIDSSYAYYDGTLFGHYPHIFSYNSDNNLDSCVTGWSGGFGDFRPGGILLYDHYGNAFYEGFESGVRGFKIFPYYSKLSTLGVTNSKSVPRDFFLSQNYPNPFNPTTVINYQLPVTSNVTLKVYNVLGKEVKTLVDGRQTAGSHSVEFNGDKLSSGVYFYSITAGVFHQVKKMILVK